MNGWLWFVLVVLCFYFNENVPQVWLSLTRPNLYTWNPKFFFGQVVGYNIFIFIFDFLRTPTLPKKNLGFLLGRRRFIQQGVKMLEGLLQMGLLRVKASWKWRCSSVVSAAVLLKQHHPQFTQVWFSLSCQDTQTWENKVFFAAGGPPWTSRHEDMKVNICQDPQLPSKKNLSFLLRLVSSPNKP